MSKSLAKITCYNAILTGSLLSILFLSSSGLLAQSELAKRNGFKDIKLGSLVDSVKGVAFVKDFVHAKEFPCQIYKVTYKDYEKIGNVEVKRVELKTYKNYIYEINVITAKDPQVMIALEKSYGKAKYSLRDEHFFWLATDTLRLSIKGDAKKIDLTYRSFPVRRSMYSDKKKKLEEMADDF